MLPAGTLRFFRGASFQKREVMKKIWLILVVFLVFGFLIRGQAGAEDAAMVMDVKGGQVFFESGDRAGDEVELMEFLSLGDQLRLEPGASLVINYFSSGRREALLGPGTITVGEDQSEIGSGVQIEASGATKLPKPAAVSSLDVQQAGAVVMRELTSPPVQEVDSGSRVKARATGYKAVCCGPGRLALLTLFETAVVDTDPEFKWRPAPGAKTYQVTVTDSSGKKVINAETKECMLKDSGKPLSPGQGYHWTIKAMSGSGLLAEGGSWFRVLSEEERAQMAGAVKSVMDRSGKDSAETKLSLALIYENYQLYDLAAEMLRPLATEHPDNNTMALMLEVLDPARLLEGTR